MDKEFLNEMPEEENEAVQAPADAEEAEAAVEETAEVENEETAEAENEEAAEAENEEVAEAENEEIAEENEEYELCPVCEAARISADKNYCDECEAIMIKRKPPILAWICGAAVILISFFALLSVFLVSAPAIQVVKGDIAAKNNSWHTAYIEYSEVDSIVSEVNSILGNSALNEFVKTGSKVKIKLINALAKSSNPLDAYTVAAGSFTDEEMEKIPSLRKYKEFKDSYTASYEALSEDIEYMTSEGSTYEQSIAKFESHRGEEGIDEIYIDYFNAAASSYFYLSNEEQLASFEKLDASAKKKDVDYRWLYYKDYINLLAEAGQNEKAFALTDEIIAEDNTASDYYTIKIKIQLASGDIAGAEKTFEDFKVNNDGYDTAYVLEMTILRSKGEVDKALELCTEAMEIHSTNAELFRQRALINLLKGNYDEAYEDAFSANNIAYNLYAYYGDTTAYTVELDHTVFVCAYLCNKLGEKNTENAIYINEILSQYEKVDFSDEVKSIVSGEKTVQQVLSEGVHDLV